MMTLAEIKFAEDTKAMAIADEVFDAVEEIIAEAYRNGNEYAEVTIFTFNKTLGRVLTKLEMQKINEKLVSLDCRTKLEWDTIVIAISDDCNLDNVLVF